MMFGEVSPQRRTRQQRSDSRKITVTLPAFFFEQLSGRVAKSRRGATRKTFMPFSPRYLSLDSL